MANPELPETTSVEPSAPLGQGARSGAESRNNAMSVRLNWLRAGVLGANDGIVSTAGLVVGVAAATVERGPILTAGVAGLVAGAVSMALGEYVSVSSQRDAEKAQRAKERAGRQQQSPAEELAELARIYRAKGLTAETAHKVAEELTARDAFTAYVDAELGLDPEELTNPTHAAAASAVAFTAGSLLPLIAILLLPPGARVGMTFVVVLVALALTGLLSAVLGAAPKRVAILRLVGGGALAMAVTYGLGQLVVAAGI